MDLFEPARLGPITLRNRILKAATYEGMSPSGVAGPSLTEFHRRLAEGGVGLTTVAYCAVGAGGRTFPHQLMLGDASCAELSRLVRAVRTAQHGEVGAALAVRVGVRKKPAFGWRAAIAQGRHQLLVTHRGCDGLERFGAGQLGAHLTHRPALVETHEGRAFVAADHHFEQLHRRDGTFDLVAAGADALGLA